MKLFLKLTDNVIKQNLRQLVLFTFLYRLVAGIFYVKTVNGYFKVLTAYGRVQLPYHRQSEGLSAASIYYSFCDLYPSSWNDLSSY